MTRWLLALVPCTLLIVTACKGETTYKDSPETVATLDTCKSNLSEKDGYVKELEAKIFDLQKQAEDGGEVVVTITGDTLEITPIKDTPTGPTGPTGPAANDKELYQAFIDHVRKSKGSIQRCYTNALKKDSGLQARNITLELTVRFKANGNVSKGTFKPAISDAFDSCMDKVVQRWKLDGTRQALTFKQPVNLSPQ